MDRAEEHWMRDLLVSCQEIAREDLLMSRSCGSHLEHSQHRENNAGGSGSGLEVAPALAANAAPCAQDDIDSTRCYKALEFVTGCSEIAVLENLRLQLPIAVLKEQLQLYDARSLCPRQEQREKVTCNPGSLSGKERVCRALDDYIRSCGVERGDRFPKGLVDEFINEMVVFTGPALKHPPKSVRAWFHCWVKDGAPDHSQNAGSRSKRTSATSIVPFKNRQRRQGTQGRPVNCPLIREQLFEWWQGMRYAVDWKALEGQNRSRGRKCLTRFPRGVLKAKVLELMQEYCADCLVNGIKVTTFKPTHRWLDCWQADYGVSFRKPNRKYKVPKDVLLERMRLWWVSVFRIRTLCVSCFGYDPEMENWDQSPLHNNESGSQNVGTIAFKGQSEVPLIEGHADTRQRWTANLVTWSSKERILKEGPPYAEYCFKAEGDQLVLKLREHLRSRGYGPWVTVVTSPKGSYREADVLNFLDHHLPKFENGRQWRIIMADDYSAHKSENVWRLCWQRGYVLILHGGGSTPVAQTPDTDMNQHVKKHYVDREVLELIQQFRNSAVAVPRIKEMTAIDMMTDLLSNRELHLKAAEGYKKTGATVAFDGTEDNLIVREAGSFWRDMSMRAIIDREIEVVAEEVRAGRLKWTERDVRGLINKYPLSHESRRSAPEQR